MHCGSITTVLHRPSRSRRDGCTILLANDNNHNLLHTYIVRLDAVPSAERQRSTCALKSRFHPNRIQGPQNARIVTVMAPQKQQKHRSDSFQKSIQIVEFTAILIFMFVSLTFSRTDPTEPSRSPLDHWQYTWYPRAFPAVGRECTASWPRPK